MTNRLEEIRARVLGGNSNNDEVWLISEVDRLIFAVSHSVDEFVSSHHNPIVSAKNAEIKLLQEENDRLRTSPAGVPPTG